MNDFNKSNKHSLIDGVSFMTLRANPKLTTNAKLVTNGNDIWMDSFNANDIMSSDKFKAVKLSYLGSYNKDISKFYSSISDSSAYEMCKEYNDETIKKRYDEQYETMYWSGCEYINSLEYDEELGFLAPLWIDETLPDYFVIFKVPEPAFDSAKHRKDRDLDFKEDILSNAEIIKTFDLTDNTKFGQYLRRYSSNENLKKSPLQISFNPGSATIYNGISYDNGNFISIEEYQYDEYFHKDSTIIEFDKYITEGFARNHVICANLINIQFLFNDCTSSDYEMNRYFGLYCNTLPDINDDIIRTTFNSRIDFGKMKSLGYEEDLSNYSQYIKKELVVHNNSGVLLAVEETPEVLSKLSKTDTSSILYIKNRNDDLYNVRYEDGLLRLKSKSIDLSSLTGFQKKTDYVNAEAVYEMTRSQAAFKITGNIPFYTVITINDRDNDYKFYCHNKYTADIPQYHYEQNVFNGTGESALIAKMLCECINNVMSESMIHAYFKDNTVILTANVPGEFGNGMYIKIESPESPETFINPFVPFNNNIIYFTGGNSFSHIRVSEKDAGVFNVGDYVKSTDINGYIQIKCKIIDLDSARYFNNDALDFYNGKKYDVLFDNDNVFITKHKQVAVYEEFIPEIGLLSFFPVKDFDFSTYEKTIYGDMGELDDEKLLFITNTPSESKSEEAMTSIGDFNFETISTDLCVESKKYLDNEYDRMYENYVKELMFLSKTAPYITKWSYIENGNNVREKGYRLNTNLAFSEMNFSPSMLTTEPNPYYYNYEWPYIMSPVTMHDTSLPTYEYWSYIGESITDPKDFEKNLKDTNTNWFERYFIKDYCYSTYKDESEIKHDYFDQLKYNKKYSIFEYGTDNKNSETMFRGAKLEVLQKTFHDEILDDNLNTIKITYNEKLNGYKFTTVIVPINKKTNVHIDDIIYKNRNMSVIRNDKFKFIVLVIYINAAIYDSISIIEKIFDDSKTIGDKYVYIEDHDWSRYLLYNASNEILMKEKIHKKNISDNTKTISVYGQGEVTVKRSGTSQSDITALNGYDTDFLTDLSISSTNNLNNTETYDNLILVYKRYYSSIQYMILKVINITSDIQAECIQINDYNKNIISSITGITDSAMLSNMFQTDTLIVKSNYIILNRNINNIYAKQIESSVFANIYYNINHFQKDNVDYTHVYESGDIAEGSTYALKFIDTEENAKYQYINLNKDDDYIYYGVSPDTANRTFRMSGYYMPLFYDIVWFKDQNIKDIIDDNDKDTYKRNLLLMTRYANTVFAYDYPGFGIIKNMCYHRANDYNNNVYMLKDGDNPVYPISNKFSIGHNDFNIFVSPWDKYYFTESCSNTEDIEQYGTVCMTEKKSFMSSKNLQTEDIIVLDVFDYGEYTQKIYETPVVSYLEYPHKVELYIKIEEKMIEYFTDKIYNLFEEYIDVEHSYGKKDSIEDDIREYIQKNVIPLYKIKSIDLYVKTASTGINCKNHYEFMSLDNSTKEANGLCITKTKNVSVWNNSELNKKLVYNICNGYDYWFGVSVVLDKK